GRLSKFMPSPLFPDLQSMTLHLRSVLSSILLACFIVCCSPAKRGYQTAIRNGDEEILRTNLSNIREVIKQYTSDKGSPPQMLSDLVNAGYINEIPVDPITEKADWILVPYDCRSHADCKKGIKDIHSSSTAKSTQGDLYANW